LWNPERSRRGVERSTPRRDRSGFYFRVAGYGWEAHGGGRELFLCRNDSKMIPDGEREHKFNFVAGFGRAKK
jgi:hypothetical protein